MAGAARRSQSGRKKQQKVLLKDAEFVESRTFIDEALAIFSGIAAVFIAASVISFYLAPPVHDVDAGAQVRNIMGPVGEFIAVVLSGAFGVSGTVAVLLLLAGTVAFWRHGEEILRRPLSVNLLSLVGTFLVLTSCAGLSALVDGVRGGGLVGDTARGLIASLIGPLGAAAVFSALLLSGVSLTLHMSVGVIVVGALRALARTLAFALVTVPIFLAELLWLAIRASGQLLLRALSSVGRVLFSRSGRSGRAEEAPLPAPRRRGRKRVATVVEEDSDEEEQDEEDEEEELEDADDEDDEQRYVVVQRSNNTSKLSARELAQLRKRSRQELREDPMAQEFPGYELPDIELLSPAEESVGGEGDDELREKSRLIEAKLRDFGILGKVTHVHPGPVITLFEFEPAPGVKVGRIAALQDDLAMSLRASSIRIIAPIPRRGTVGIEVPNKHRDVVRLRDVLESKAFHEADSVLSVSIGKDTYGEPVVMDIATMPHLLMAGATGTGKSVCINTLLLSLLYRASPAQLGLILIDPKVLELSIYEGIPHLRVPVVTVPRQAKAVLEWAVNEMNRRYRYMQKFGVRNIDSYNKLVMGEDAPANAEEQLDEDVINLSEEEVVESGIVAPEDEREPERQIFEERLKPLPKIVIVIDELADLMLTVGRDIEELITRLAQKARAAGIHLIVATQRPSVDVITGLIKANFPARLSFRVTTRIDSRTILDGMGAEKLLGRGDMLFMVPGGEGPRRVHGAFVSDAEVKRVVDSIKAKWSPNYDQRMMELCERALVEDENERERKANGGSGGGEDEYDEMYDKCVELVVQKGQASTSMLQRAFRLGYNRAARIIDMMEREGIVGPMDGAKPREVRIAADPSEQPN